MIEIKRWTDGKVLYTAENAQDIRTAVEEAVAAGVNFNYAKLDGAKLNGAELNYARLNYAKLNDAELNGAELNYAELNYAELNYAKLNYAKLNDAELNYAKLNDAELNGAELNYAKLDGAKLNGAELNGAKQRHPLWPIRQDMFSILDQAPAEVAALREAMVEGKINGSTYSDGKCGCLCGTIGIVHAGSAKDSAVTEAIRDLGIQKDSSRPAEQFFISIRLGDKPLPLDTKPWPSESVFRISQALAWLDEWVESRTAIAMSLTP